MRTWKGFVLLLIALSIIGGVLTISSYAEQTATAESEDTRAPINGPHWSIPLSVQMQDEILDAWNNRPGVEHMTDFLFSYYGTVGKCVVLAMARRTPIGITQSLYAYYDGNFDTLENAAHNGLMSMEQLILVNDYRTVQQALTADVEIAIKMSCADKYAENGCLAEELTIRYFGEYDGCHVAFIDGGPFDYTPMEEQDMVAGFPFDYVNGQKLEVYKDGQFLTLTKAFEAGWLSEEAVGRLWNYYTNGIYELPKTGDAVLLPALWMLLSSAAALPLLLKRRNRY